MTNEQIKIYIPQLLQIQAEWWLNEYLHCERIL